jgi:hypothetical protein
MVVSFIVLFSAILFCYWLRRVEMLLNRPEDQTRVLNSDLSNGRNLWSLLRSMFLPALASHSG